MKEFGSTIQRYKNIAIWSLIGTVLTVLGGLVTLNLVLYQSMEGKYMNLETNFFSGYVNLKDNYQDLMDNISEVNRALGHLESVNDRSASQGQQGSHGSMRKNVQS